MYQVIEKPMKKGPQIARVSERVDAEIKSLGDDVVYEIWDLFATNQMGIRDLAEKKKLSQSAVSEIIREGYEAWGNNLHEIGYKAGVRSMTPPRWPSGAGRLKAA